MEILRSRLRYISTLHYILCYQHSQIKYHNLQLIFPKKKWRNEEPSMPDMGIQVLPASS